MYVRFVKTSDVSCVIADFVTGSFEFSYLWIIGLVSHLVQKEFCGVMESKGGRASTCTIRSGNMNLNTKAGLH